MALQAHEDRRARHRPQARHRRLVGGQLSRQGAEPQLLPRTLVDAHRDGRTARGWGLCPRNGRMSRMRDISQPLHAAVPVWPGEPPFALHSHAVIGDGCPGNVGAMFTPLHAGTHGDAPLHYANAGASSADCDLEANTGPSGMLDVSHGRGGVGVVELEWDRWSGW